MKKQLLVFLAVFALALSPILPATAAVSISITSPTTGATTATDFTVTGTAEAGNEVTVSIDGTDVGTATADGSGDWSLDVTGQTDGAKTITATATGDTLVHIGSFANTNMTILDASTDTAITGTPFSLGTVQSLYSAITSDNSTMYLTDLNNLSWSNIITVVDLTTRTVTDTITLSATPSDFGQIILSPDDSTLYVAIPGTNLIDVIDTATNTIVDTLTLNNSSAAGLAITQDGSTLYVTDINAVDIVDTATNTFTSSIGSINTPSNLTLSNDGSTLYASDVSNPGNIYVIDTASETVTDTITDGKYLASMVISPDDSTLYVVSQNDWSVAENSSVLVIDTATNTVTNEVETGRLIFGRDITPDGSKLYVVNFGNPFDGFNGAGTWTIDTSTNTATFLTGSEELNSISGEFIFLETATASVNVTVSADSDSDETLADTGINKQLATIVAVVLLVAGIYLYRPRQQISYKR